MGTKERRERDRLRRREDILTAARTVLVEKGYESATIDEVARAAELAKGTIYLYFASKEDIYVSILDEGLDLLTRLVLDSYQDSADPLMNLLAALDAGIRFETEYQYSDEFALLKKVGMTNAVPALFQQRFDEKIGQIATHVQEILEEGIVQGKFRSLPTREAAFLLLTMSHSCSQVVDFMAHSEMECRTNADSCEAVQQIFHDLISNSVMAH